MTDYPYLEEPRPEMLPFLPASARRVLDVGCGVGGFCRSVKSQRPEIEVVGIEPHGPAAEAASLPADRVVNGSFRDALVDPTLGQFDAIFFNDVLEHMVDPWTAVGDARRLLSDGGRIVASIPNIRFWTVLRDITFRGTFTYTGTGILDRTHLRFFTKATMVEMFSEQGYRVRSCVPINMDPRLRAVIATLPFGRANTELRTKQFAVVAEIA